MTHADALKRRILEIAETAREAAGNGAAAVSEAQTARMHLNAAREHFQNSRVHALQEMNQLLDIHAPLLRLFEEMYETDPVLTKVNLTRELVEGFANQISTTLQDLDVIATETGKVTDNNLNASGRQFRQAMQDLMEIYSNL